MAVPPDTPAVLGPVLWLSGIVGGAVIAGFVAAWKIAEVRSKDRHDIRAGFDQKLVVIEERLTIQGEGLEKRINALELQNASTLVILEHMREFRVDITDKLAALQTERRYDMDQIHARLNAIVNLSRHNDENMHEPHRHARD